ncbi:YhdP family protein [uncultured Shewanella sp.]|uniref:YhdP family protein n=1 Tax=uncultured Shewanella sp. TaxID=173975 RepID=UPI0026319EAA|nr:YhdP family protein [uncultured Shewanella sp.]
MFSLFGPFKVLRFCWLSLAALLVLFALLVSLIRGLLPELDQVRAELVDYVQQTYQVKVEVGQLHSRWRAFGPALTVTDLVLPKQKNLPLTFSVAQAHIKLDFWQSLLNLSPQIETVIFDGIDVTLNLDALKDNAQDPQGVSDTTWLYGLLLEQLERFTVRDASITLESHSHKYNPIYIKDLVWRNRDEKHLGKGLVYLDDNGSVAESLSLNVALKGNGYRPDSLVGQMYLAANSLDIGHWASRQPARFSAQQRMHLKGAVNLEAWVGIAHRNISSADVNFKPSWLTWYLNKEEQDFTIEKGQLSWRRNEEGWALSSSNLAFSSNNQSWPIMKLGAKEVQGNTYAYLNQIDIGLLQPLLPLLPSLNKDTLDAWQLMAPEGKLLDLRLHQQGDSSPQISVNVQGLTWQGAADIPSSTPVDLTLMTKNEQVYFSLPPQNYSFDFNDNFKAPLTFKGKEIIGQFNPSTMAVVLPDVSLKNDDMTLKAAAKIGFQEQMTLGLLANLSVNNIQDADKYFPLSAMGKDVVDYLDSALKEGKAENGVIIWQGALKDYPYNDHSGMFQAGFNLKQGTYQFQPDWPAITHLSLYGLFENAAMDLWVKEGDLLGVPAKGTHVSIDNLVDKPVLGIQSTLSTKAKAAKQVINQSPLSNTVGETLKVLNVKGKLTGALDLSIPLYGKDNEIIKGTVNFKDNPVYVSEPGIQLSNVTGEIQFKNEVVTGKNISATLYNQPVNFDFYTGNQHKKYAVNVDFNGHWQLGTLSAELNNPLSDYYRGTLDWTGGLLLAFDDNGYSLQGHVNSDLLGTELLLPGQFHKDKSQKRALSAEIIGDDKQLSLGVKVGKQSEFWGAFDFDPKGEASLASYDLLLGRLFKPGDKLQRNKGHLQLALDKANFMQWDPIIKKFIGNDQSKEMAAQAQAKEANLSLKRPLFPTLKLITGHINNLDFLGHDVNNVQFTSFAVENAWRLKATSEQFTGYVDFYPNWREQGLKIAAQKLYLQNLSKDADPDVKADVQDESLKQAAKQSASASLNDVEKVDPFTLPPLAINAADFRVGGKQLGQLVLQASPTDNAYQIQTLSLSTPEIQLQGKGAWYYKDQNKTRLKLTLTAKKFDAVSKVLGIDPGLKDAPLSMEASLAWIGAPYEFSLDTLSGQINFELGKGHLTEVSDKGARILSLFSLDSILRKLTLDFSDVFGKGLYFDSFKGTLDIENGVAKTTNTEMKAIVGDMKVRGYTNLLNENINYDIKFMPKLASSVPTVVLLTTGGWTFGLGAFVLTKVLEPVIEVISELRFRVTGTMSEPKLKELPRKSKEIQIPESVLSDSKAAQGNAGKDKASVTDPSLKPVADPKTPTSGNQ